MPSFELLGKTSATAAAAHKAAGSRAAAASRAKAATPAFRASAQAREVAAQQAAAQAQVFSPSSTAVSVTPPTDTDQLPTTTDAGVLSSGNRGIYIKAGLLAASVIFFIYKKKSGKRKTAKRRK
jgi:hypothetical protein